MDKAERSMWTRFFREAGIPSGFDTKYALLFDENRIKKDMLMDLNKECLKDMGITAMGDIIAILKHAKLVDEEYKAQAYDVPQPSSTVRAITETSSRPDSASAPRDLKKVIVNSSKPGVRLVATASPKTATASSSSPAKSTKTAVLKTKPQAVSSPTASTTLTVNKPRTVVTLKRTLTPPPKEEVPLQKKVRVLPEQEGGYIVKMPDGSVRRTQSSARDRLGPASSFTASVPKPSIERKISVFSRLGDSHVTSTSDLKKTDPTAAASKQSSVFSRLGQNGAQAANISADRRDDDRDEFLKTKFEVRQSVDPTLNIRRHLSLNPERTQKSPATSTSTSKLRSATEGREAVSVKARLGTKGSARRSPSRSLSPPIRGRGLADLRLPVRSVTNASSRSLETPPTAGVKSRLSSKPVSSPAAIRKAESANSSGVSVSREVVRRERFVNAAGKTMIRKVIMKKTVRGKQTS